MATNKKHLAQGKQNPWVLLLMGCVLAIIAYGFASWAIDSGSIFIYAATFIAVWFSLRSFVRILQQLIRN